MVASTISNGFVLWACAGAAQAPIIVIVTVVAHASGDKVVAVVDRDPALARRLGRLYGATDGVSVVALAAAGCEAAVVATDHASLAPSTRALISAGCGGSTMGPVVDRDGGAVQTSTPDASPAAVPHGPYPIVLAHGLFGFDAESVAIGSSV